MNMLPDMRPTLQPYYLPVGQGLNVVVCVSSEVFVIDKVLSIKVSMFVPSNNEIYRPLPFHPLRR